MMNKELKTTMNSSQMLEFMAEQPLISEDRKEMLKQSTMRQCETLNRTLGKLNLNDGYDCEECLNRGFTYKPKEIGGYYDIVAKECKCEKIRRSIRNIKKSGLETILNEFSFDGYLTTEEWQKNALIQCEQYVNEIINGNKNWLYFGGQSGCGKTHLCTAICSKLLWSGYEVKYMLWRDEISRIKSMTNTQPYYDAIKYLKSVDVLYIDDLFKTGKTMGVANLPTQADINIAFEIINSRYMEKKTTIISSELTLRALTDIDEAITGRIYSMAKKHIITIEPSRSRNYRLKREN